MPYGEGETGGERINWNEVTQDGGGGKMTDQEKKRRRKAWCPAAGGVCDSSKGQGKFKEPFSFILHSTQEVIPEK